MTRIVVGLAALTLSCRPSPGRSGQSAPPPDTLSDIPARTPSTSSGSFAYVDSTGTQLLAFVALHEPIKIRAAACAGVGVLPVRYDRRLSQNYSKDTGRQEASNFRNQAGNVYQAENVFRVVEGKAWPHDTCYLSADSSLLANAVNVHDLGSSECLPDQSARLAAARPRRVMHCWRLGRTPSNAEVLAAQYATIDTNALASLVVMREGSLVFQDMPAVDRGDSGTVWRVDDGGIFSPQVFRILFVAELPHAYVMAIEWEGVEGDYYQLLRADSTDAFRTLTDGYRYHGR